jgi:hypothetical protein
MADVPDRLKVLIDSSTPIIVMETVEEMRAVRLVPAAASALNLAAFEWSIAGGLARCGVSPAEPVGGEVLPPGRRGKEDLMSYSSWICRTGKSATRSLPSN